MKRRWEFFLFILLWRNDARFRNISQIFVGHVGFHARQIQIVSIFVFSNTKYNVITNLLVRSCANIVYAVSLVAKQRWYPGIVSIERFSSLLSSASDQKRIWNERIAHMGYLSPPYQLCGISRTQRNLAIVERCRRPDVSTQTYLTPVSRYSHSTNACVYRFSMCRAEYVFCKNIENRFPPFPFLIITFEIDIFIPIFFYLSACESTQLHRIVRFRLYLYFLSSSFSFIRLKFV